MVRTFGACLRVRLKWREWGAGYRHAGSESEEWRGGYWPAQPDAPGVWEGTPDPELRPETWQKRVMGVLTCERGRMGLAQRDSRNSQAAQGP